MDHQEQEFLHAAEHGHASTIVKMLALTQVNVNCQDANGNTPLMKACQNCFEGVARLLLEGKADIHMVNKWGNTALHECFTTEIDLGMIDAIVLHGAKIDAVNHNGQTPLMV